MVRQEHVLPGRSGEDVVFVLGLGESARFKSRREGHVGTEKQGDTRTGLMKATVGWKERQRLNLPMPLISLDLVLQLMTIY